MNDIVELQNSESSQRLMKARTGTYRIARNWQILQIFLSVILPITASFIALAYPWLRPYAAFAALTGTFLDVIFIDRQIRRKTKEAAVISEMFDCQVLHMPWNSFVAGKPRSHEDIVRFARWCKKSTEPELLDWYPVAVKSAPIEHARSICQRTNLFYDSRIRGRLASGLIIFLILYVLVLFALPVSQVLNFQDFLLSVVIPSSTVATWSLREYFRQCDAIVANDSLRTEVESQWHTLISQSASPEEIEDKSRRLQDGIFNRRALSAMHLPLVYKILRSRTEEEMKLGAEKLLQDAGYYSNVSDLQKKNPASG